MKSLLWICLLTLLNISGCSDNNDTQEKNHTENKDHVWKEQTDSLEKARAVEGILQDSADAQHQQEQDQTQ